MSLELKNPDQTVDVIVEFMKQTFKTQRKAKAVIAVSGGIDSALSLTLLTKALGAKNITTLFLPYSDQSIADAQTIANFNKIPAANQITQNIEWMVEIICSQLKVPTSETVRMGNIMARARMMTVYDTAKKLDALVVGTENKSEHYLGYFTRFGDAASDLEPISTLYKTQVRQLAEHLKLPQTIITKPPSAGLWQDQTDETELGFSYDQADQVLVALEKNNFDTSQPISVSGIDTSMVNKVVAQVRAMAFKRQVPYELK